MRETDRLQGPPQRGEQVAGRARLRALCLQVEYPLSKMLGIRSISDFGVFLDFGVFGL